MANDPSIIFNRRLLRKRKDRAAHHFSAHDFLIREAADRLADRLDDMARDFPLALDLGCHNGILQSVLQERGHIQTLIQSDLSEAMLKHASGHRMVCDEEWLPFSDGCFDLVMSVMSLQFVNDLPGTLIQIRRILKPDGLFLCIIPGANSMAELRDSMAQVEMEIAGGISPRVVPMLEVRDAGALLQRAGFALPVVDSDMLTITYENLLSMLHDLRGMGATNPMAEQNKRIPPREFFARVNAHYAQHFSDAQTGRLNASCELITLTGWAPADTQQQPAKRGSGKVSLKEVLN